MFKICVEVIVGSRIDRNDVLFELSFRKTSKFIINNKKFDLKKININKIGSRKNN